MLKSWIFLPFALSAVAFLSFVLSMSLSQAQSPAAVTYTYDSLGRLVGDGYANYTGAKTLTYTYDKSGNRTQSKIQ